MRAVVVVESAFGNTRQIGQAIADGLGGAELIDVGDAPDRFEGATLVVVGGPTHAFGMSRESTRADAARQGGVPSAIGIREWLQAFRGTSLMATFDTRIDKTRGLPGSAARGAARLIRRKRATLLTEPKSFYVRGSSGPLVDGELAMARRWGAELAALVGSRQSARSQTTDDAQP